MMQAAPTPIVPRGSTEVAFAPIPPTATVAIVSRTNFSFYFNLFIRVVWCGVVLFVLFCFVLICFDSVVPVFFYRLPYGTHLTFYI